MYLQKVISRKNCVKKLVFCWHLDPNPDLDPLVRGMDPLIRIRIHPKKSCIRNTVLNFSYDFIFVIL
jgi:hypothetical protein